MPMHIAHSPLYCYNLNTIISSGAHYATNLVDSVHTYIIVKRIERMYVTSVCVCLCVCVCVCVCECVQLCV